MPEMLQGNNTEARLLADEHFLRRIAYLYYEDGNSQETVVELENCSRQTVGKARRKPGSEASCVSQSRLTHASATMHETLDRRVPPRYNKEERSPRSRDVQAGSHVADKSKEGVSDDV